MTRVDRRRYSNTFDALRLFAALSVLVHHTTVHLKRPFLWHEPSGPFWFGDGVALFFVLSGFLVYRSCDRCFEAGRSIRDFYVNRFLRVAPAIYAYMVAVLAGLLVLGVVPLKALGSTSLWAWVVSHLTLIPVYHPEAFRHFGIGVLNGSLWTIPVEVGFYIAVPLFCWAERRFRPLLVIAVLCVLAFFGLVVQWWFVTYMPDTMVSKLYEITPLSYLVFFGLGICWAKLWDTTPQSGTVALASLALYIVVRYRLIPTVPFVPIHTVLWALPFSYLVFWVAHHGPTWVNRFMVLGDISYGVYVWHMVVVNSLLFLGIPKFLDSTRSSAVIFVLLCTVGLAMLSWRFIERPALSLKPFSSRAAVQGEGTGIVAS